MTSSLETLPHLAGIDLKLRERLWCGNALVSTSTSQSSGYPLLDRELPGGGWPTHCLTEVLLATNGIGEMRLLAPTIARLSSAGRQIIVLAPPRQEGHDLYPDGWAQMGIDISRLLIIRTDRPSDRLWALEQSLKSAAFGALLAWLPQVRPEALRRLQLAAAGANGLCFLLRPAAAQHDTSPAPLRLVLESAITGSAGRAIQVKIIKRRGPVLGRPLLLPLTEARPVRRRVATELPGTSLTTPKAMFQHALGRPPLPDIATQPHPAPAS